MPLLRACLLLVALSAAIGCRMVEPHTAGKSPLAPLAISPDAISLEVFSAPLASSEQAAGIWQHVDEQPLSPELRARLDANGLRAGIVGPSVPEPLAALLKVTGEQLPLDAKRKVPLDTEPTVSLRVLHAQAGRRIELAIPHTREEVSLLECIDGMPLGRTYRQAECRLALKVFPETGGRLRMEIVPELHHGEFKSRVRGNDGMWMMTQERPKRSFQELKLEPKLAPGQMFVIGARDGRSGSAGDHFFTNTRGEKPTRMLWVMRAAGKAADRMFYDLPTDDEEALVNDQQE